MIIDDLAAVRDARWLNRSNSGKDFCIDAPLSVEHRKKISESQLGRVLSDDHRKKLSTAKMGRSLSKKHREAISIGNTGRVFSIDTRKILSIQKLDHPGHIQTSETRCAIAFKMKNKIWITNGIDNQRIDLSTPIYTGWRRGRTNNHNRVPPALRGNP